MGLLVGLPLGIFRILLAVLALAFRFGLPLLALFLIWRAVRKFRGGARGYTAPKEPEFDGPVYNVDYKIVEDEKEE